MSLQDPLLPGSNPLHQTPDTLLTIPVVQESFEVEKVLEHTGTVRVRKLVHTERQAVGMDGFREVIETEIKPVNRLVEAEEAPREEGSVLIIPVYEERLVRQLVLREEMHLTRRRETVPAGDISLRREEIVVERLDPVTRQWVTDPDHT